jgi:hypothetical protein
VEEALDNGWGGDPHTMAKTSRKIWILGFCFGFEICFGFWDLLWDWLG